MESLTSRDVQAALDALGLSITVHTYELSTATAELAAGAIGCELGQIIKSLAFILNKEKPILVLVSGDQIADDKKLAKLFDIGRKKIKMANADECIEIYGYAPGGVPPIGHRTPDLPVYIDENFQRYETVYGAAGTANTIFPIPLQTLVEVTDGTYADVAK